MMALETPGLRGVQRFGRFGQIEVAAGSFLDKRN